jgi:hypothetical protein
LTQNWVSPTTPLGHVTSERNVIGVSIERRDVFIGDAIFTAEHWAVVDAASTLELTSSRSPSHPATARTAHVTTPQTCAIFILSSNVLQLTSRSIVIATLIFGFRFDESRFSLRFPSDS